jgi:hypothetical protein
MRTFEPARQQAWFDRVVGDPEFRHVSRWTELHFTLLSGDTERTYLVDASGLAEVQGEGDVVLAGAPAAWADFLAPVPPPHSNHVLAMDRRRPDFEIRAGRDQLIRHLRVLDIVLQHMRPTDEEKTDEEDAT